MYLDRGQGNDLRDVIGAFDAESVIMPITAPLLRGARREYTICRLDEDRVQPSTSTGMRP